MDVNSNRTPGLDLPQPASGDNGFVSAGPASVISSSPQVVPNVQAQNSVSIPADDSSPDVLDQEWVDRAKDIVEKTKSDPFTESRELSKVKAAYLKARYNKNIKVHEDSA